MSSMREMLLQYEDKDQQPSAARIYDYLLGGLYNTEVDRLAAEQLMLSSPTIKAVALTNRAFLRRVITFLAFQGIAQFLDIGSGIPTVGNIHDIAHQHNPEARIVYTDIDPMAVALSLDILRETPQAIAIDGDLREPDLIVSHSATRRMLSFSQPIALCLISVLHFLTNDAEAYRVIAYLRDVLPVGSYLVIAHGIYAGKDTEGFQKAMELYKRSRNPLRVRTREEIAAFFGTWNLIEPGLVWSSQWHPDGDNDFFLDAPEQSGILVGVARKNV